MTLMSGTRRASRPCSRAATAGFTLLEVLVVLALLGLATALVAPSGIRMIGSWRRATDVDAALGSLSATGARARDTGRAMHFAAGPMPADTLPGLPEGWTVELSEPLVVQANGACSSSRGELRDRSGYRQAFAMEAPFCRAVRKGSE